jgi:hypothetical protein
LGRLLSEPPPVEPAKDRLRGSGEGDSRFRGLLFRLPGIGLALALVLALAFPKLGGLEVSGSGAVMGIGLSCIARPTVRISSGCKIPRLRLLNWATLARRAVSSSSSVAVALPVLTSISEVQSSTMGSIGREDLGPPLLTLELRLGRMVRAFSSSACGSPSPRLGDGRLCGAGGSGAESGKMSLKLHHCGVERLAL